MRSPPESRLICCGCLPGRAGVDLDAALERVGLVLERERRLAAAEKLGEHLLEVDLDLLEGLREELARGAVDFLDRLQDLILGREQVGLLAGEELVALLQLVVLGDGLEIDRPERVERGPLRG